MTRSCSARAIDVSFGVSTKVPSRTPVPASAHSTTLGATAILASERVARPGRFADSVSGAQIAYCGMPRQRMTSVVSLVCTSKVARRRARAVVLRRSQRGLDDRVPAAGEQRLARLLGDVVAPVEPRRRLDRLDEAVEVVVDAGVDAVGTARRVRLVEEDRDVRVVRQRDDELVLGADRRAPSRCCCSSAAAASPAPPAAAPAASTAPAAAGSRKSLRTDSWAPAVAAAAATRRSQTCPRRRGASR